MTTDARPDGGATRTTEDGATVLAFERPPVRQATLVRSDVDHTFDVFVRTLGTWWPVNPFSVGEDRVRDVTVEPRLGGRVYETWDDGHTATWGEVVVWDRPHAFGMTWDLTPVPTEVQLTFRAVAPGLTRVAVEHSGWERLSDEEVARACALPDDGGYAGGSYVRGWAMILEDFRARIDGPGTTPAEG